ncbi:hypothetical protein ABPG77_005587 [Micractinium sp. CCAP 211/92]
MSPRTLHLPRDAQDFWLDSADVLLRAGAAEVQSLYLAHSAVLALASPHLATLCSMARGQPAGGAKLPVVSVFPDGSALPADLLQAGEQFESFLAELYRHGRCGLQWDTIKPVLLLADYFGATGLLSRADAWLCDQLSRAEPSVGEQAACQAFELAARHRLGAAMALLLPWAVQSMARGSRCASVWYDGKQRCSRLQAAFADSQLKALVLDAFWWSRQASDACSACGCRPADVEAGWETRREWAAGPGGSPGSCAFQPSTPGHARAARHYAHLLAEACWGVPSGGEAGPACAAFPVAAPAAGGAP